MIAYYRDCKKNLQLLMQQGEQNCGGEPRPSMLHAGRKFKKSIEKDKTTLEFAPTNLHIQQMKVTEGEKESTCQCKFNAIAENVVCMWNK